MEDNMQRENRICVFLKKQKRVFVSLGGILLSFVLAAIILTFPLPEGKQQKTAEFSQVSHICELATLKCYYHNVARVEKDPEGLFDYGWGRFGYKRYWAEYDGIIIIGIDASKVVIGDPDEEGIIRVELPDAYIMDVIADEESMSTPIEDAGIFSEVTIEEKTAAFEVAQDTMEANASSDVELLQRAKENARKLLEKYILSVGESLGEEYKIKWEDVGESTDIQQNEPNTQESSDNQDS